MGQDLAHDVSRQIIWARRRPPPGADRSSGLSERGPRRRGPSVRAPVESLLRVPGSSWPYPKWNLLAPAETEIAANDMAIDLGLVKLSPPEPTPSPSPGATDGTGTCGFTVTAIP